MTFEDLSGFSMVFPHVFLEISGESGGFPPWFSPLFTTGKSMENPWRPRGVAALPVEFPHGGGAKGVRPEVLGPAGRCWDLRRVCQNEDQNAIFWLGEKWGEER